MEPTPAVLSGPDRVGRAYLAVLSAVVLGGVVLTLFAAWSDHIAPSGSGGGWSRTLLGAVLAAVTALALLPVLMRRLGVGAACGVLTIVLLALVVVLLRSGSPVVVPVCLLVPAAAALITAPTDGSRRVGLVAVAALLALVGVGTVLDQQARASRYADQIEATGLTPYAPDGWVADDVGSWSTGELRYRMHDASGQHIEVTVRRPPGAGPGARQAAAQGLVPYQQTLLDQYGVLLSLESYGHTTGAAPTMLPDEIGSELRPRDVDWLADRACWSCRFVSHLVDGGALFG